MVCGFDYLVVVVWDLDVVVYVYVEFGFIVLLENCYDWGMVNWFI